MRHKAGLGDGGTLKAWRLVEGKKTARMLARRGQSSRDGSWQCKISER